MRIIFMGTSEFAACSLRALQDAGHDIAAVFTRTDKPAGRKMEIISSPVKKFAEEIGLPIYQPKTLRTPESWEQIKALSPELIVVVAYGMILPRGLLEIPPLGCVNLHGSILPRHRGASPINAAILSGDEMSGVTTMYMSEGIDEGDIIQIAETPVGPAETAGELYERLKVIGAELLCETLGLISEGRAGRIPQDAGLATFCGRLDAQTGLIDWTADAASISRLVRGLNPVPGAYTFFKGKKLKIHMALPVERRSELPPGSIEQLDKEKIVISCGNQTLLAVTVLQLEGKKTVGAGEFSNGYRLQKAQIIG